MELKLENLKTPEKLGPEWEKTVELVEEIKKIVPEDEFKFDLTKLSAKTRTLLVAGSLALYTAFGLSDEAKAQQAPIYGSNIPSTSVNTNMTYPANWPPQSSGPSRQEQIDHQKVEVAAGCLFSIFRFIGHRRVDKKYHSRGSPSGQPGQGGQSGVYTSPRR